MNELGNNRREREATAAAVLSFYRELPLNYGADTESQMEGVRGTNPTDLHPPLRRIVNRAKILEVGSGAGWLSNGLAYHHRAECLGIDFNQVAVDRARETARALDLTTRFEVADLFEYTPRERYPLVISLGVLHHTGDCQAAIRHICRRFLSEKASFYLGLYHLYGRQPFLDHFKNLQDGGVGAEQLESEFARLYRLSADSTHLRSWFRDQVLHPHETQHTYKEIRDVLEDLGLSIVATSLNAFKKIRSHEEIEDSEPECIEIGKQALREGRYYPGFFTVMAQTT
jgi:hypothetical protein